MDGKRIFLSPPHMSGDELYLIQDAFESNFVAPLGPMVDAFEREFSEYTGIPFCAAVSSGTAAMHLALRCLGVAPGDEVFASSLTFIASVTSIIFQGGTPVFVDSDHTSWNMDPILLEEELERCSRRGKLPKAVIPTDLYGQCCNYHQIIETCSRYGVPVVIDAAEAMGAKYCCASSSKLLGYEMRREYLHSGVGAKASIFSFNGNKIITTSGGGMLASEDRSIIEDAKFLSQQARDPAPHYEHSRIGYNYRMSNIVAAIGRGQLRVLDQRVEQKRKIFKYYREALSDLDGIEFMPEAPYGMSNRWLTVVLIDPEGFGVDRETVRLALEAENVESRPLWKPMHLQPLFRIKGCNRQRPGRPGNSPHKQYKARIIGGAVSEYLFARGLCLPSGTQMTECDLERVVGVIKKVHDP